MNKKNTLTSKYIFIMSFIPVLVITIYSIIASINGVAPTIFPNHTLTGFDGFIAAFTFTAAKYRFLLVTALALQITFVIQKIADKSKVDA